MGCEGSKSAETQQQNSPEGRNNDETTDQTADGDTRDVTEGANGDTGTAQKDGEDKDEERETQEEQKEDDTTAEGTQ